MKAPLFIASLGIFFCTELSNMKLYQPLKIQYESFLDADSFIHLFKITSVVSQTVTFIFPLGTRGMKIIPEN